MSKFNSHLSIYKSILLFSLFLGFLAGCELPADLISQHDLETPICCEYEDGSSAFTSFKACDKAEGYPVNNEVCEESSVALCCEIDGVYQLTTALECKEESGQHTSVEQCSKICCATDHPTFTITTQGNCDDISGYEVEPGYCEPQPAEVCCKTNNGIMWTSSADCEPNQVLDDSYCEDPTPTQVCCETQDGLATYFTMSNQCSDDHIVPLSDCDPHEPLCCRFPDGFQIVNAEECPPQWVSQDQSLCEPTPEEVCCKTADGNVFLPEDQCPDNHVQPDFICEETETVCCDTTAGVVPTSASECDAANVQPDAACEDYATVCCEMDTGYAFTSSMDCPVSQMQIGEACWEPIWNNQLVCCSDVNGQGIGWTSQNTCSAQVLSNPECDGIIIP